MRDVFTYRRFREFFWFSLCATWEIVIDILIKWLYHLLLIAFIIISGKMAEEMEHINHDSSMDGKRNYRQIDLMTHII